MNLNLNMLNDIMVSSWVSDIQIYTHKNITYWIHKIKISDNWFMTNFNYNLTNVDLKTIDIDVAENRSLIIINNKINIISNAINTLSSFTKRFSKNSLYFSPELHKSVIDFTEKIRNLT